MANALQKYRPTAKEVTTRKGRALQYRGTTGMTGYGQATSTWRPPINALRAIAAPAPASEPAAGPSGDVSAEGVSGVGQPAGPEPQAMTPAELTGFLAGLYGGYPTKKTLAGIPSAYTAYSKYGVPIGRVLARTFLGPYNVLASLYGGIKGAYAQRGMFDYDPATVETTEKHRGYLTGANLGFHGSIGWGMGSAHERDYGEPPAQLAESALTEHIGRPMGGYHEAQARMEAPQLSNALAENLGVQLGSQHERAYGLGGFSGGEGEGHYGDYGGMAPSGMGSAHQSFHEAHGGVGGGYGGGLGGGIGGEGDVGSGATGAGLGPGHGGDADTEGQW